jgi:hypothetical protein
VSQALTISPDVIFDTLTGDTQFMSYVGTYTFLDSTELDAISVLTPGSSIKSLSNVTGLEVIIHDVGPVDSISYIDGPSDAIVTWNVYLVLWPPENGDDLTNAIKRMIYLFSGAKSINTLVYKVAGIGTSAGAYTQALVTIPQTSVINT